MCKSRLPTVLSLTLIYISISIGFSVYFYVLMDAAYDQFSSMFESYTQTAVHLQSNSRTLKPDLADYMQLLNYSRKFDESGEESVLRRHNITAPRVFYIDLNYTTALGAENRNLNMINFYAIPYRYVDLLDPFGNSIPVTGRTPATEYIDCSRDKKEKCIDSIPPFDGVLDCLSLDVHMQPWSRNNKSFNRPIIIWLGEVAGELWRLVAGGLIVIRANYRRGCYGFLCHHDQSLPYRNQGVNDVLHAIDWTIENARHFAGDISKITLAGHGASASLVEYIRLNHGHHLPLDKYIVMSANNFGSRDLYCSSNSNVLVTTARLLGMPPSPATESGKERSVYESVRYLSFVEPKLVMSKLYGLKAAFHPCPLSVDNRRASTFGIGFKTKNHTSSICIRTANEQPVLFTNTLNEYHNFVYGSTVFTHARSETILRTIGDMLSRHFIESRLAYVNSSTEKLIQQVNGKYNVVDGEFVDYDAFIRLLTDFAFIMPTVKMNEFTTECGGNSYHYVFDFGNSTHGDDLKMLTSSANDISLTHFQRQLADGLGFILSKFVRRGYPVKKQDGWCPSTGLVAQIMEMNTKDENVVVKKSTEGVLIPLLNQSYVLHFHRVSVAKQKCYNRLGNVPFWNDLLKFHQSARRGWRDGDTECARSKYLSEIV
ncbi:esterase-lipase like protein [Heliothis virescens ascovirus 3i]|nr:esterase-lipase like protein [Heliothis virescens ascovirus 3i]